MLGQSNQYQLATHYVKRYFEIFQIESCIPELVKILNLQSINPPPVTAHQNSVAQPELIMHNYDRRLQDLFLLVEAQKTQLYWQEKRKYEIAASWMWQLLLVPWCRSRRNEAEELVVEGSEAGTGVFTLGHMDNISVQAGKIILKLLEFFTTSMII